jgi:hypothetical protein
MSESASEAVSEATPDRTRILRLLLEGAVVVVFLFLIWNNASLRRQVHAAAVPTVAQHGFVPRDFVASIPIVDLNGKAGTLDLKSGRTIVAIVDPRCESCRELVASMRGATGIRVISLAPADESREMADASGLTAWTATLGKPLPRRFESQLQIYPQLFVVDRGNVVRSCAALAECQ